MSALVSLPERSTPRECCQASESGQNGGRVAGTGGGAL